MQEHGLSVDPTPVSRWVQQYAPELDKRCRPHLRPTTDSWQVDETDIKVKGQWKYLRQTKYLNNIVEQDHRFIKRRVKPGLGFTAFRTAWRTLRGYESMHMIRKGQVRGVARGDVVARCRFIDRLFGIAA